MVKKSSFLLQSLVTQAATMIKKEEHEKECDKAAALIQRHFRKHSEERALAAASDDVFLPDASVAFIKPSLAQAASLLGNSTAASIALSTKSDDFSSSSSSEEFSSDEDEDEDQFVVDYNGASKGEMTVLTEPYYGEGKGMEEEKEEEKVPLPEQAPEKRSGKYLWGVAAGAVGLVGATMVAGKIMGGGPADEDDVVALTGMIKGGGGGGGAGGGGGGTGGGATGATTSSAQMTAATQAMATSAAQSAASSVAAGTSASAAAASSTGLVGAITGASVGVQVAAMITVAAVAVGIGVGVARSRSGENYRSDDGSYKTYPGRLDIYFQIPLQPLTLGEGEKLTDLVVDRYNDLNGCDSEYSRLMLETTTIRCSESKDEFCMLVGQRLLCKFDTMSTCAGCLSSEPLFADPENEQSGGSGVGEWSSGVACFNILLSRSNSQQACVDATETLAPNVAPTTAYPTVSPSTSFPTLSPLTAIVFAGIAAPAPAPVFN